jgi:phosphoglycolate phosphatase
MKKIDTKKTIIFDLDGTLVDSFEVMLPLFNRLALKYATRDLSELKQDEIRKMTGSQVISYIGIRFWRIPFAIGALRSEFHKYTEQVKAFEKIPNVLNELKKSNFLGIVTTNSNKNVKKMLKFNDINCFDFILSRSKLFKKDKILESVIRRRNLEKKNVCYVGDEVRDIEAAKKVGIPIIAVTWGYNSKEVLVKYDPDFLAEQPNDIIQILGKSYSRTKVDGDLPLPCQKDQT